MDVSTTTIGLLSGVISSLDFYSIIQKLLEVFVYGAIGSILAFVVIRIVDKSKHKQNQKTKDDANAIQGENIEEAKIDIRERTRDVTQGSGSNATQQTAGRDVVNVYLGYDFKKQPVERKTQKIVDIGLAKIIDQENKIKEEDIQYLGEKFTEVFQKNNSSRNGLMMIQGAIFALGTKDEENPQYREHCALSLRELFGHWEGNPGQISNAFNTTFRDRNSEFPTMRKNEKEYGRMGAFYDYFSEICHQNSTNILYRLRALYGEDIKQGDDNDERFLSVVKDFFSELITFMKKNVK